MTKRTIDFAFFRSNAVHFRRWLLHFPEHIRSSIRSNGQTSFFPEQCRSILFCKRLVYNFFRGISVHVLHLSRYLCVPKTVKCKDMAGTIIDMSKIKQMLQFYQMGHSNRRIAKEIGMNKETVNNYFKAIRDGNMDIKTLLKMDDPELERKFHAGNPAYTDERMQVFLEELPLYRNELSRKHVTRYLVWQEYIRRHPDGYCKSQFFFHLKQNLVATPKQTAVLTDTYVPGEKLFIDFAGDKLGYVDPETGEIVRVEVFVASLPYSDYAYAICVPTQRIEDFLYALRMCLEELGGVPRIIVPDNLKSAVIKADRYEPTVNKALEDMGNFYHFAILPCQPKSPTQKALVEDQVRLVYRRIYAKLRDRVFYSIHELNEAVWKLLKEHNQTRMQKRPYSREERFHAAEKDQLQELPEGVYEMKYYTDVHVQKNGYVEVGRERHNYSVPYIHIGKKARVIFTRSTVKVYVDGECVATHMRSMSWGYTTVKTHLASNNRAITDRSPQYYISRARMVSPIFGVYITELFSGTRSPNPPEVYYKTCDMLLRLSRTYGREQFDATCRACLEHGIFMGKRFEAILKNNLFVSVDVVTDAPVPTDHRNMRGNNYYK